MKKALYAIIAFCLCYGLQIVLQQYFLQSAIHPLHLNFLTSVTSFMLLTGYFFLFNKKHLSFKTDRRTGLFFLAATLLWIIADLSTNFGLKISSSVNFSVISRLQVFITYILAILFFKEKFTNNKLLAVVFAFIGGLILVYNFQSSLKINLGDLLFIMFALSISLSGLLRQKITKTLSHYQLSYMMFGVSSLVLGIITFAFFPLQSIPVPTYIVFNAAIGLTGFVLVNYAISVGGATFFSVGSSLLPLTTAIFSFFIFQKLPTVNQIVGASIIILGIMLFRKK